MLLPTSPSTSPASPPPPCLSSQPSLSGYQDSVLPGLSSSTFVPLRSSPHCRADDPAKTHPIRWEDPAKTKSHHPLLCPEILLTLSKDKSLHATLQDPVIRPADNSLILAPTSLTLINNTGLVVVPQITCGVPLPQDICTCFSLCLKQGTFRCQQGSFSHSSHRIRGTRALSLFHFPL